MDGSIAILYENGLEIYQNILEKPYPDYEKLVKQEKNYRNYDSISKIIKINGFEGIGDNPGYNITHFRNKEPRPGYVQWHEGNTIYTIYGWGISLRNLIEIAESMENVQ